MSIKIFAYRELNYKRDKIFRANERIDYSTFFDRDKLQLDNLIIEFNIINISPSNGSI